MRRADRLFQIVQHLRGGRLVTARMLSERLEVSERTIYRDIADLQASGVPVDGEAGIGYLMRDGYDLPPLMFTRDEITALVAGARMVRGWGGASMARAAEEALVKIEAVLPPNERNAASRVAIHAPRLRLSDEERDRIDLLEKAADKRVEVSFAYRDVKGQATKRSVRPLGLWFWGGTWTLVAWCLLRDDFRVFRIDRMETVERLETTFRPEPGQTLRDFYRAMEASGASPAGWDLETGAWTGPRSDVSRYQSSTT